MSNGKFITNSYIEEIISKLTQEETGKRQYYRPVYSLHKWWARRPGALFRSIILLATKPELSNALFEQNSNSALSECSNYFHNHDIRDVIILDPFMGGGTTLIEANRLGAKVIGCDINPVSFWVVRESLKPIDLERLDDYFHQLEQTAGKRIKLLYLTVCTRCKTTQCDGLYVFWVRYVNCPHCGRDVHLFKRTLLNEGMSRGKPVSHRNPAIVFCPQCNKLNEWHGKGSCTCKQCSAVFDPQIGTYDEGYYTCPHCNQERNSLVRTMKAGQRLREKLVAIEYWCPRCKSRLYKAPDKDDIERFNDIQHSFESLQDSLLIPKQQIPEGSSSERWRLHNYRYYYEVFNARQLIAFNYLLAAIREIPEEEYRNAFITVFSNSLEYNNMMTPYNYPHRKLHHLFNYHALPLTTTPVENAVWGVSEEGAGTFVNCYKRYVHAKMYCQRPFDKFKDSRGVIRTIYSKSEKIAAHFVSSFEELKQTPRGALLFCGDSSRLSAVPSNSVDLVVTDPPYFDNIHYSELSNFFYIWLSLIIKHPYFATEHVPVKQEAIVNKGMDKDEEDYQHLMASVFRECKRILKDEGRLIFTFHHTKWRAWWTVLTALIEGGFLVADSFPVMSEYRVNPHLRNKQALDMDLVLVCQKRAVSLEPMCLSLEEIVQCAMNNLPLEVSNRNENNRLFLCFMGGLLKAASMSWDLQKIRYEWFADTLALFDNFLAKAGEEQQDKQTVISNAQQLELF